MLRLIPFAIILTIAAGTLTLFPQAAEEDPVKSLVARLDLEKYKAAVKGLTQFGDRQAGTERNRNAGEWIKAQLESYNCFTDKVKYVYQPEPSAAQIGAEQVFCTKVGTTASEEVYIVGAHMDGQGSGAALVLELARIFSMPDVQTERSIRFVFWNNVTGYHGARAYIDQRREMQGKEDYPGSGNYPEPRWLGLIELDMMVSERGRPAPVNIEFQSTSRFADDAAKLAGFFRDSNEKYAADYRAAASPYAANTESNPFIDIIPSISLRGNYSDNDFRLGLNAAQTTVGAVGQLARATLKK